MDLVVAAVVVPWIAVMRLECHNRTSGWRPWDADGFGICLFPTQKKISPSSTWIPMFNFCQVDPKSCKQFYYQCLLFSNQFALSLRFSWSQTLISVWKLGMQHSAAFVTLNPTYFHRIYHICTLQMEICSEDERKLGTLCGRRGPRRHYLPWTEWLDQWWTDGKGWMGKLWKFILRLSLARSRRCSHGHPKSGWLVQQHGLGVLLGSFERKKWSCELWIRDGKEHWRGGNPFAKSVWSNKSSWMLQCHLHQEWHDLF